MYLTIIIYCTEMGNNLWLPIMAGHQCTQTQKNILNFNGSLSVNFNLCLYAEHLQCLMDNEVYRSASQWQLGSAVFHCLLLVIYGYICSGW